MKIYKVTLTGRNYLMDFDGEPRKLGFSSVRYVRSKDADEAERQARRQISCHPTLVQGALNGKMDPPVVEIESIKRCWVSHLFHKKPAGLRFFTDEDV